MKKKLKKLYRILIRKKPANKSPKPSSQKKDSMKYPNIRVDAIEVFGDKSKFGVFKLYGRNWLENKHLPIALCWGFNNWKYGFTADYLDDYRVAFAPRKFMDMSAMMRFFLLEEKPSVFFIWGYTETKWVRLISKLFHIPIYRMEDAFVRSSGLGAEHNTPYSLVIEKNALYYDARSESDLENFLNYYDFNADKNYSEQAQNTINMLVGDSISKYNLSSLTAPRPSLIKTRKKVLVIGQVDGDAAIRFGNPDKWSMEDIIQIAKQENPDAEVIYRPHPEVYKNFQESKISLNRITDYAKVVNPDIPFEKFIDDIDHVYVISSLSGVEALIRGVKVTTFGVPFYAGWGLTDDRAKDIQRRNRKISLLQLVYGLYIKYPTYLADKKDSYNGLQITCLRIKADKEINKYEELLSLEGEACLDVKDDFQLVALLIKNHGTEFFIDILKKINFYNIFNKDDTDIYQNFMLHALYGSCNTEEEKELFLERVKIFITPSIFNKFLMTIYSQGDYNTALKNLSWLAHNVQDYSALSKLNNRNDFIKPKLKNIIIPTDEIIQCEFENKNYDLVINHIFKIMLAGNFKIEHLNRLIEICFVRFDNHSVDKLSKISIAFNYKAQSSKALSLQIKSTDTKSTNIKKFIADLLTYAVINPEQTLYAILTLELMSPNGEYDFECEALKRMVFIDSLFIKNKTPALLALNHYKDALLTIEYLLERNNNTTRNMLLYSQALTYNDRKEDALFFMLKLIEQYNSPAYYKELLRVCTLLGKYDLALDYLEKALSCGMNLGDMTERKIYFGGRKVKEAFNSFKNIKLSTIFSRHYRQKAVHTLEEVGDKSIILFNIYGPGDEIRFASIYPRLKNFFPNIMIGCEPRLLPLFERSFTNIKFTGTKRIIRTQQSFDVKDYNQVPERELIAAIDNNAVELIKDYNHTGLVTDFLGDVYKGYEDFSGLPFLVSDKEKVSVFSKEFKKYNNLIIGLSWRSSLTTHSRNEHYLTIEELAPLLEIDGVTFVNLQYDECNEELAWAQKHYPNKIINIDTVDQYNDFDTVAAMMDAMDLVIAPATTVVELAGAIGCKTWLLSNSSELHWRKIDPQGTDVWCHNITHIEGDIVGDKKSLVKNLKNRLESFVHEKQRVLGVA